MHHRSRLAGVCLAGISLLSLNAHADKLTNTTYVEGLQQTPLYVAIDQPTIEALYAGANGPSMPTIFHPQPMSWGAIGVSAAGGALGMAVVSATIKAGNHKFAETHIAPLRAASSSDDLRERVKQGVLDGIKDVSWLNGGAAPAVRDAHAITPPPDTGAWLEVHARYALSTDFSHVVVMADIDLFRPMPGHDGDDWRHQAAFHNTVVFQSQAIPIDDKTPADTERMLAEENAHWNQAAIDAEIDAINNGPVRDPDMMRRRKAVMAQIEQHKRALAEARFPLWNPDQLADRYAAAWGEHDSAALKQALYEGGQELSKMVALTFSGKHDNVDASTTDDSTRRTDCLTPSGDVTSLFAHDPLMVGSYFTGG